MKKYSLKNNCIYRKEWFGCLVCNVSNGHFFQFNKDVFYILSFLEKPISIISLLQKFKDDNIDFSEKELNLFLKEMIEYDIITDSPDNTRTKIYFKNKKDLRKDCLVSPSSVTIYITQYCGKACRHCVTNASPKVNIFDECSVEEWKKILQQLREIGVMSLVFTGGEPLMKNGIFDILEEANKLNFSISLLTDYDDISKIDIEKLKSINNLNDIQVSLDGGTKESHDFIRGEGSFSKTIKRLSLLKESGIDYTISCSVNKKNLNEIDKIVKIYKKYEASYLYLNPVAPYGRAKKNMINYILNEEELYYLGQKYLQIIKDCGVNPGNNYWIENLDKINNQEFNPFKNALNSVSLGIYNFSIGQKGECYLDSKMKAENMLYLGNALTDSILDMWNNKKLDHLRSFYSPNSFAYIEESKILI